MKKLLLGLSILISNALNAGGYEWVKVLSDASENKFNGIVTDNYGVVYLYGTNTSGGSFIKAYSNEGQLLNRKEWPEGFTLNKLIWSEEQQAFFFAGNYSVKFTSMDGHPLSHFGNTDACFGMLGRDLKVSWLQAIGGDKEDEGNGICVDQKNNRILVTGSCEGRVKALSGELSQTGRAIYVAGFTLNGQPSSFKSYDFANVSPSPEGRNVGHAIGSDRNGNIYLLVSRVGRPYVDPNTQYPELGEYVLKLDEKFQLKWSSFVISPACYYGYDFGSLEVSEDGYTHVRKRCDAKYGGSGSIQKFEPDSGKVVWSHGIQEAHYSDISYSNTGVYATGYESAHEVPSPAMHFGYYVFKRISGKGNTVFEQQSTRANFVKVAGSKDGSAAYILGTFTDSAKVGSYELNASGPSFFLVRYADSSALIPGIKDKAAAAINVYPNPSKEKLIIESPEKIMKAELIDYAGNVIIQVTEANRKRLEFNISNLAEGVYIYRLTLANRNFKSGKVVVTK